MDKKSISKIACEVFDRMDIGTEFSGLTIKAMAGAGYELKYPDTFMRKLRATRRDNFICINVRRGIYRKISDYREV